MISLKKAIPFLLILCICFSICSCKKADTPIPVSTAKPLCEIDLKNYTFNNTETVYDLFSFSQIEGKELCTVGFLDNTILALYVSEADNSYSIAQIDETYGTIKTLFNGMLNVNQENYYFSVFNFSLCSLSPFAFVDTTNNWLYIVEKDYSKDYKVALSNLSQNVFGITDDLKITAFEPNTHFLYTFDCKTDETQNIYFFDYQYEYVYLKNITNDGKYAVLTANDSYTDEALSLILDIEKKELVCSVPQSETIYACSYDKATTVSLCGQWQDDEQVDEEKAFVEISVNSFSDFTAEEIPVEQKKLRFENAFTPELYISEASKAFVFTSVVEEGGTSDFSLYYSDLSGNTPKCVKIIIPHYFKGGENSFSDAYLNNFSCSGDNRVIMPVQGDEGTKALLLWNTDEISTTCTTASTETLTQSTEGILPEAKKDYGALSDKAEALEEKYSINIALGEKALIKNPTYEAEICEDEELIAAALDNLDKALGKYPEGFIKKLYGNGYLFGLVFAFVEDITPIESSNGINYPGAYTCEKGDYRILIFNIQNQFSIRNNFYHEISHVIDAKLDYIAASYSETENAISWSDEEWNKLNPEGFSYYESYRDDNGGEYSYSAPDEYTPYSEEYLDSGDKSLIYFMDNYGKTFATEDRALLMEGILDDDYVPKYMGGEHLSKKLEYYFKAIRQVFDKDGDWTDPPAWEKKLTELNGWKFFAE